MSSVFNSLSRCLFHTNKNQFTSTIFPTATCDASNTAKHTIQQKQIIHPVYKQDFSFVNIESSPFNNLGDDEIDEKNLEMKIAHFYESNGDKLNAIKYLKRCISKPHIYKEDNKVCQSVLAALLCETEQHQSAVKHFDCLWSQNIFKNDLYFRAGYSYFQCNEYEKAIKCFDSLINLVVGRRLELLGKMCFLTKDASFN
eukprot:453939_1